MRGNDLMQIGYMRISKGEQTTALQEDALAKAAVERTYRDVRSGVRDDRPQFQAMLDFARPRDQLSEPDRACGYINTGREVYLPSFWGTCRNGARCDPAADQGWTGSSSCARAHRRQARPTP